MDHNGPMENSNHNLHNAVLRLAFIRMAETRLNQLEGHLKMTMSGHIVRTQCRDTMLGHNVGTQCWDTMLGHNVGSQCWDTMSGHNVGTQCS